MRAAPSADSSQAAVQSQRYSRSVCVCTHSRSRPGPPYTPTRDTESVLSAACRQRAVLGGVRHEVSNSDARSRRRSTSGVLSPRTAPCAVPGTRWRSGAARHAPTHAPGALTRRRSSQSHLEGQGGRQRARRARAPAARGRTRKPSSSSSAPATLLSCTRPSAEPLNRRPASSGWNSTWRRPGRGVTRPRRPAAHSHGLLRSARACVTSSACVSSKQPHCWPLRRSQNSTLPAPPAASRCPPAARQCSGSRSAAPKLPVAPRPAQRAPPAARARRARGPASAGARACSPPGRSARPTRAARRPCRRTAACGARRGRSSAP